jgi:lipoprotein-anchoring transpeptidase ErfK/SrfK
MRLEIYKSNARLIKQIVRLSLCLLFIFPFFLSSEKLEVKAQSRAKPKATSRGNQILEAEKLLSAMGYWIKKVDRAADDSTRHAIIAFQKVERRKRTGVLTAAELQAMRKASRPNPKSASGAHIEVDITRQVLFLVNDAGVVTHILSVSTGNEKKYFDEGKWQVAHTPRGNFKITRQINGVRKAPLGSLFYPSYFHGGVAIHGSPSVPVYPASHGCVRIPNFAAKDFLGMVSIGMPVMVYD